MHFFFNPLLESDFFIATQDACFTKKTNHYKFFETVEEIAEKIEETVLLQTLDEDMINGLVRLDILSRVLRLKDVITNPANFGRTTINHANHKWIILDFQVKSLSDYNYPVIFEDFCQKNSQFSSLDSISLAINQRTLQEKIHTASNLLYELEHGLPSLTKAKSKKPLLKAIELAYQDTLNYVQQQAAHLTQNGLIFDKDLSDYKQAVIKNFTEFHQDVQGYQQKLSQTSAPSV